MNCVHGYEEGYFCLGCLQDAFATIDNDREKIDNSPIPMPVVDAPEGRCYYCPTKAVRTHNGIPMCAACYERHST